MNSEQTKGLLQVRDRFVADQANLASIEPGTVHTKLDVLTLNELRYLSSFPAVMRSTVVDLDVSEDQLVDDTSPIYDIAHAARLADRAIDALEGSFETVKKNFHQEMLAGFRLESVMVNPKYNEIMLDAGLKIETVTLRFLREFDAKVMAEKMIDRILVHLGFDELKKMYDPNGPALRLDRLIEAGFEGMKDGPNPALFEALAARVIDDVTEAAYGLKGFVKQGHVQLKIAHPSDVGTTNLPPGAMWLVEVGVRPSLFKLTEETETYFPNFPHTRIKPKKVSEVELLSEFVEEFESKATKGSKFKVAVSVFTKTATFLADYGKVIQRPASSGVVKLKLK